MRLADWKSVREVIQAATEEVIQAAIKEAIQVATKEVFMEFMEIT